MLHLAGYDHEIDNGEMLARETEMRQEVEAPRRFDRAHAAGCAAVPMQAQRPPRMNLPLSILLLFLLALLTLVSYVNRLHHEMGKFLSREFQENIDAYEQRWNRDWASPESGHRSPWQC